MTRFTTLTAAATAALLALAPQMAAAGNPNGNSGTIRLGGTVATDCTVSVQDANVALNLTGGESARTVGSVVENCNSGTGYTISITSANSGALTSGGAGTSPIAYTVGYENATGALNSALTVNRDNAQFNRSTNLTVTIPASSQYIAGSYADTVTVTIAAR